MTHGALSIAMRTAQSGLDLKLWTESADVFSLYSIGKLNSIQCIFPRGVFVTAVEWASEKIIIRLFQGMI